MTEASPVPSGHSLVQVMIPSFHLGAQLWPGPTCLPLILI